MFIGEYENGVFAMPAVVEEGSVPIVVSELSAFQQGFIFNNVLIPFKVLGLISSQFDTKFRFKFKKLSLIDLRKKAAFSP